MNEGQLLAVSHIHRPGVTPGIDGQIMLRQEAIPVFECLVSGSINFFLSHKPPFYSSSSGISFLISHRRSPIVGLSNFTT
jgi:hypothetical protein